MDFFENTFKKIWQTKRQKIKIKASTVQVSDINSYLKTIVKLTLSSESDIQVVGSLKACGFLGETLYLPDQIGYFSNFEDNQKLYLYLTLVACAIKELNLYSQSEKSNIGLRIQTLKHWRLIQGWLNQNFNNFGEFHSKILNKVIVELNLIHKNDLFYYWQQTLLGSSVDQEHLHFKKTKENDQLPLYLHYTVPELLETEISIQAGSDFLDKELRSQKQATEKKKNRSDKKKPNQFNENESANPVSHSFEKMETADTYEGGRKIEDGDDDLDDHMNSLDEVELKQMTTQGDQAKSIYREDVAFNRSFDSAPAATDIESTQFMYPEWNQSKLGYQEKHCRLWENNLNENTLGTETDARQVQDEIKKKYRHQISLWQSKINNFLNEPLWLRKQKDGSELDIDSIINHLIQIKNNKNSDERFYAIKKNQVKDLTLLFLLDQSLSTDSWVDNQRVMDVILDSLSMAGIIFDQVLTEVLIAGTSSSTRKRIEYTVFKGFKESWFEFFKRRHLIESKGYTRLGPGIRHSTELLRKQKSRKKILILLTDGKPTDLDRYEGVHGVMDIHHAVLEAECQGIYVHALTIESSAKDYFKKMFHHYSILNHPHKFPEALFNLLLKSLKK